MRGFAFNEHVNKLAEFGKRPVPDGFRSKSINLQVNMKCWGILTLD